MFALRLVGPDSYSRRVSWNRKRARLYKAPPAMISYSQCLGDSSRILMDPSWNVRGALLGKLMLTTRKDISRMRLALP